MTLCPRCNSSCSSSNCWHCEEAYYALLERLESDDAPTLMSLVSEVIHGEQPPKERRWRIG